MKTCKAKTIELLNENIFKGALPKGVDFYKMIITRSIQY